MAGWYVKRGEKLIGPFSPAQLKEHFAAGKLKGSDQIAKDPAGPWTEIQKTNLGSQTPTPADQTKPQLPAVVTDKPQPPAVIESEKKTDSAISKVAGGMAGAAKAFGSMIEKRAQRKHELKLEEIRARVAQPTTPAPFERPEPPAPVPLTQPVQYAPPVAPTIIVQPVFNQSTTVTAAASAQSVAKARSGGGSGCLGCVGKAIVLTVLVFVVLAIITAITGDPNRRRDRPGATPASVKP